jgi:hypothetical protein
LSTTAGIGENSDRPADSARRSRHHHALDAIPEGTRVTNAVELELRGPGRLLGPVAVPRVRDAVAANLQKLKELLEQEAAPGRASGLG